MSTMQDEIAEMDDKDERRKAADSILDGVTPTLTMSREGIHAMMGSKAGSWMPDPWVTALDELQERARGDEPAYLLVKVEAQDA